MADDKRTEKPITVDTDDTIDDTEICAQCKHSYYEHDEVTGKCDGSNAKCTCARFVAPEDLDEVEDDPSEEDDEDEPY